MKNLLGSWLNKHEKIHCILKCFRHIKDDVFVHDVLHMESDYNIVRLSCNGEKHKGKILYKIDANFYNGFFAMFRYVLIQMYIADAWGAYPVVVSGEKFPHYEQNGVNGEKNPWEYYFVQYGGIEVADLNEAYRIVRDVKPSYGRDDIREINKINTYKPGNAFFTELAPIVSKYIHLQPNIDKYIKESVKEVLNEKKTLGVQIRMGGMLLNWKDHPVVPELGEYVEKIQQVWNSGEYEQIFLATDDIRALKYMRKCFGEIIVYYNDVTRVKTACSVYDINKDEELHGYKCGLEVLRDMYTLSECEGLVAGISQVSISARLVKMSRKEEYIHMIVVDKGINSNGKNTLSKKVRKEAMNEAMKDDRY